MYAVQTNVVGIQGKEAWLWMSLIRGLYEINVKLVIC